MGKVNKDPTVFGSTDFSLIIVKDVNLDWVITQSTPIVISFIAVTFSFHERKRKPAKIARN